MKKIYLLILSCIFSLSCFSQELTGTWIKKDSNRALQFTHDGYLKAIFVDDLEKQVLQNISTTFTLSIEGNIKYMTLTYFYNGKSVKQEKIKYKVKDGKLYMPKNIIIDGVETTKEYEDVYEKYQL